MSEAHLFGSMTFPEIYERVLVQPLFRPFAQELLTRLKPAAGDSLLDVACGTGIVARLGRERIGPGAKIVKKTGNRNIPRVVDNSPASELSQPSPKDRLIHIIAAFVGPLTSEEAEGLRRRIDEDGVGGVWRTLEPALREDRQAARREVKRAIAERRGGR